MRSTACRTFRASPIRDCELYRSFALPRAGLRDLISRHTIGRAVAAAVGHGVGPTDGDSLRMPGIFLIQDGRVLAAHRHASVADRPDYLSFVESALVGAESAPESLAEPTDILETR